MTDFTKMREHAEAHIAGRIQSKAPTPTSSAKLLLPVASVGKRVTTTYPAHAIEVDVFDAKCSKEVDRGLRSGLILWHSDNTDPSRNASCNRSFNCFNCLLVTTPDAGYAVMTASVIGIKGCCQHDTVVCKEPH
jgi:hypothetical protein